MDDRLSTAITAVMDFSRNASVTARGNLDSMWLVESAVPILLAGMAVMAMLLFMAVYVMARLGGEGRNSMESATKFTACGMMFAAVMAAMGLSPSYMSSFGLEERYAETRADCAVLLGAVKGGDLRFMPESLERAAVRACGTVPLMDAANSPHATLRLAMASQKD